jgi:uroporphyrinogen decarboxylase
MTVRENTMAILNYKNYDALPIVHFGYWQETLQKWAAEGHLKYPDNGSARGDWLGVPQRQGFDFEWGGNFGPHTGLVPAFERKVISEAPDGTKTIRNFYGVTELQKADAGSIPAEIDHLLKDRASWEEHYLPRLQYSAERLNLEKLRAFSEPQDRQMPFGLLCGSLFGTIRNWLGVTGASYLYADDEDLYDEIIDNTGDLTYRMVEETLSAGSSKFDYAHFWEDICFKNGPLVIPSVFEEKVGPYYKKITSLLNKHGINIVSLDCDGMIDSLLPIWLENGVNTMFPIEVGTWHASIAPWREKYGRELRGVGGMDKKVFALDRAAIDAEIERLKPLIDLGGFIPCPDHRIAPDAKWDNVCYYAERLRAEFC